MKIAAIIPARMKSTRLPGKPLLDIAGLPLIVHVFKRVMLARHLSGVYVATDDKEIFNSVKKYGGNPVMTSGVHKTGTDRIAEAAAKIDADFIINVQGDEPLVDPLHVEKVVEPLLNEKDIHFSCLACRTDEIGMPNEVKLVTDLKNNIMYFSREDIPSDKRAPHKSILKLYNVVAFRKEYLLRFASWPQTPLEKIEFVEYLRILENSYAMRAVIVKANIRSVDTEEDLVAARELMQRDRLKLQYMK